MCTARSRKGQERGTRALPSCAHQHYTVKIFPEKKQCVLLRYVYLGPGCTHTFLGSSGCRNTPQEHPWFGSNIPPGPPYVLSLRFTEESSKFEKIGVKKAKIQKDLTITARPSKQQPPHPTMQWLSLPALPALRSCHAMVVLAGNRIVSVGGRDIEGSALATVVAFDYTTDKWSSLPDLPAPRYNHGTVVLADNRIVCVGGYVDGGVQLHHKQMGVPPRPAVAAMQPRDGGAGGQPHHVRGWVGQRQSLEDGGGVRLQHKQMVVPPGPAVGASIPRDGAAAGQPHRVRGWD